MARLRWLPEAIEDFERLYFFLLEKDTEAAEKAASNIIRGSNLLKRSPRIGRLVSDDKDKRELFIAFGAGAYVIRYRLEAEESVVIVRVWHSRENRTI
jgi:plasmid stabilization system protein ParE